MASVKGGLMPGPELTADSVPWRGLAQRPWAVSEQHPRGSGSRNRGTDKPASTGCLTPLGETLEILQECLQLQPKDDQSKQPGRKPTAALGNQEGRTGCLEPHRGEAPWPRDCKSQIRGLCSTEGGSGAGWRKTPGLLISSSAPNLPCDLGHANLPAPQFPSL